jgi:hypothetical protein
VSVDFFVVAPRIAVIVTGVEADTEEVLILNVALLDPDRTETLAGTIATEGSLLVSDMEMPLLGAIPVSFTVPVELAPLTTEPGLSDNELSVGAVTVSGDDFVEPPLLAVIVIAVDEGTGVVVTPNVPFVAPAGTEMLDGTSTTDGSLDVSETVTPPEYAGPVSVTVPLTFLPPVVDSGEIPNEANAWVTPIEVDVVVPLKDASIVTVVFELTGLLLSVKIVWSEPAGTATLAGTGSTDGLLLVKATIVPPAGALLFKTTAAVTGPPPSADALINEIPPSIGTTPKVFV